MACSHQRRHEAFRRRAQLLERLAVVAVEILFQHQLAPVPDEHAVHAGVLLVYHGLHHGLQRGRGQAHAGEAARSQAVGPGRGRPVGVARAAAVGQAPGKQRGRRLGRGGRPARVENTALRKASHGPGRIAPKRNGVAPGVEKYVAPHPAQGVRGLVDDGQQQAVLGQELQRAVLLLVLVSAEVFVERICGRARGGRLGRRDRAQQHQQGPPNSEGPPGLFRILNQFRECGLHSGASREQGPKVLPGP
jgi:hypothetical protein